MIRIILLALLFFSVVAISPTLIGEKGYILIAMGDFTIESTVVTAIIMLSLVVITLLIMLKVLRGGIRIGFGSWHRLVFANRRRGLRNFNQGIVAYLLDDYAQAEQLMAKSAESAQQEQLAWLVAASASAKQSLKANTDHYLNLLAALDQNAGIAGLASSLVTIKLLLAQQDFTRARTLIDALHKHLGHDARLLTLELDLCVAEQRFETAAERLVLARKQKEIKTETIRGWEAQIYYGILHEKIKHGTQSSLQQYWQSIPKKIRQQEAVLLAYGQVLAEQQMLAPLNDLLIPALKPDASAQFLRKLRGLPITHPDTLMALVQKHLHHNEHSGKWLSCLAHLALAGKQWPKAEKAFNALFKLAPPAYDNTDLVAYAKVLSAQGYFQKANELLLPLALSSSRYAGDGF